MKRIFVAKAVMAVAVVFLLSSCEKDELPVVGKNKTTVVNVKTTSDVYVVDNHLIQYMGTSYDGIATSFTYHIKSGTHPSISHWNIIIPQEVIPYIQLRSSSDPSTIIGYDGSTQTFGLKFDTGYSDNETRTVTFSVFGEWPEGVSSIIVKAGQQISTASIPGPDFKYSGELPLQDNTGKPSKRII